MTKPTFTIGVFAAIFDEENRILFCHRTDQDNWNLPGGCLEHGESPWDGVIREVKEETGYDVRVERLAGIYSKTYNNDIVMQFICVVVDGEKNLNSEADKIKYFAFADIPNNTFSKHVERVKDILENPSKVATKTHTGKSSLRLIKEGLL